MRIVPATANLLAIRNNADNANIALFDAAFGLSVVANFAVTQASPAAAAACIAGQIVADTGFLYTCASTGVWKRVAVTGGY